MRHRTFRLPGAVVAFSLVALCAVPVHAAIGTAKTVLEQLAPTAASTFAVPAVREVTLRNGMRCFLLEDHLLPLFRFGILYPGGAVYDPSDKVGLSTMLAALLRSGGTKQYPAAVLDGVLDQEAIRVSFDMAQDYGTGSVRSLAENQDRALELFFDMMYAPAYAPERLAMERSKLIESIRRRNDQPGEVGERIFREKLYGPQNPWARTPQIAGVEAMQVGDLQALHATLFAPSQMLCAAAGDFHGKSLVRTLESLMARYPAHVPVERTPPPVARTWAPGVWLVEKAVPQAVVEVGQLGTSRDDPDKYALLVMNDVLGSPMSFNSWLTSTIRTKHGLAYQAWSMVQFGPPQVAGFLRAHSSTRADAAGQTVRLIHEAVANMAAGEIVQEAEVVAMRDALLKRMIFQYEDPYQVVSDLVRFTFMGYPRNYLEVFQQEIARVGLADVRRVAKAHLHPDQLTTVVVGDPAQLLPQLQGLGDVQQIAP